MAIYKLITLEVRKNVITVLEILYMYIYFYTHGYQSVSCTNKACRYKLFWHRNENTVGIVGKILCNHITKLKSLYQINKKKIITRFFFSTRTGCVNYNRWK